MRLGPVGEILVVSLLGVAYPLIFLDTLYACVPSKRGPSATWEACVWVWFLSNALAVGWYVFCGSRLRRSLVLLVKDHTWPRDGSVGCSVFALLLLVWVSALAGIMSLMPR